MKDNEKDREEVNDNRDDNDDDDDNDDEDDDDPLFSVAPANPGLTTLFSARREPPVIIT